MQTAKLCYTIIKECSKQEFKFKTLLSEFGAAIAHYFTSNSIRFWWRQKG